MLHVQCNVASMQNIKPNTREQAHIPYIAQLAQHTARGCNTITGIGISNEHKGLYCENHTALFRLRRRIAPHVGFTCSWHCDTR